MAFGDWIGKSFCRHGMSAEESLRSMVSSDWGDSGAAGTGISLATDYTPASLIRQAIIVGAGNFCFETPDGNPHVIPVSAGTWFQGILISKIYGSAHATYPTTATGIHVF